MYATYSSVRENVCNNSKNVKSHVFWIFKKTWKKFKNVRIIFHRCLMFIVPVHCCQSLTSFTLDVQQWLRMDGTRDLQGNWIMVITERSMWTHFDALRTKLLLKIFTTFWYVILKKRKKSCFLKSEKNVNYVFSNSGLQILARKRFPLAEMTFKCRGNDTVRQISYLPQ